MENNNNVNINHFATELSALIGQHIGVEHIHASTEGRYYYIQAPKPGAPMLLHHYRGAFFIDIHPDDFEDISSGKVSAYAYITSANWQVGYYWGGGSMVGGGYYQPLDLVGHRDEVRRYLQILSCRGLQRTSSYIPTEKDCADCSVEKCPVSKYKRKFWYGEMQEHDPRCELFIALVERLEQEYPGYTLQGFLCLNNMPDGEIWLTANRHYDENKPFSFQAYASNSVIRSLLMHETEPENWTEYAKNFHFRIHNMLDMFNGESCDVNEETLEKAFEGLDYTKKAKFEPEADICEEKVSLLTCVANFFKKMF